MLIIAGLGNPGEEYLNTRHNVGRMVAQAFAKRNDFPDFIFSKKYNALISERVMTVVFETNMLKKGKPTGAHKLSKKTKEKVMVILPETFMNKSGSALKPLVSNAKKAEQLIVIHDDLDLAFGSSKLAFNRGSGGHRGVESVIRALKTEAFTRLKIGISPSTPSGKIKKPSNDKILDFIIGKFKPAELEQMKKISKESADYVKIILEEGRSHAAGSINNKKK
ncbi:MAG: aminoacyl-tRNA hydrolase [Candidatus Pacebacteria bacterium]|nr:aminoacyl-tRNA hydrolase [Candidatus Paceibacterota bacterium]